MDKIPGDVLAKINDFRFGAALDWKKSFKRVMEDMENWFFYFKEVYEHTHYMDIDDDDKFIDFIRVSTLKNLKHGAA
jgi:hypothetical protein